jgi:hypothetical protein
MKIHKDLRALAKQLRENGCEIVPQKRSPHAKLMKDGQVITIWPTSIGDPRAMSNFKSQLRQKGVL